MFIPNTFVSWSSKLKSEASLDIFDKQDLPLRLLLLRLPCACCPSSRSGAQVVDSGVRRVKKVEMEAGRPAREARQQAPLQLRPCASPWSLLSTVSEPPAPAPDPRPLAPSRWAVHGFLAWYDSMPVAQAVYPCAHHQMPHPKWGRGR